MEPLTPAPVVLEPKIIDEYGDVRSRREALAKREKQLKEQASKLTDAEKQQLIQGLQASLPQQ